MSMSQRKRESTLTQSNNNTWSTNSCKQITTGFRRTSCRLTHKTSDNAASQRKRNECARETRTQTHIDTHTLFVYSSTNDWMRHRPARTSKHYSPFFDFEFWCDFRLSRSPLARVYAVALFDCKAIWLTWTHQRWCNGQRDLRRD